MKDMLGQQLVIGSTVLWLGGRTMVAGGEKCEVVSFGPKTVRLQPIGGEKKVSIHPGSIICIDLNLAHLKMAEMQTVVGD